MSRRFGILFCIVMAAFAFTKTGQAAPLVPSRAEADAREVIRQGKYSFCKEPSSPLSQRARQLCPLAEKAEGCEGFKTACATLKEKERLPNIDAPKSSASIASFLAYLVKVVMWLAIIALIVAITLPIVYAILKWRRDREVSDPAEKKPAIQVEEEVAEAEPVIGDAELLLQRAAQMLERGDFVAAVQLYFQAAVAGLDQRGILRIAKDRTNGEYVRSCQDLSVRSALREIAVVVDKAQFGGEKPTAETAGSVSKRALALVRGLPLMILLLALLGGCKQGEGKLLKIPNGADPAGREMMLDLLKTQGVNVGWLERSLASLPIVKEDETGPAIFIDTDTTPVDEETNAHLVRWVESGGFLIVSGAFATENLTLRPGQLTSGHVITIRPADSDDSDDAVQFETTTVIDAVTVDATPAVERSAKVAWFSSDEATYGALIPIGKGNVLALPSDELFTNAGLAVPANARAMVALMSHAHDRDLKIAARSSGIAPPSNPMTSLIRAGLGLGLIHLLFAIALLFWAFGRRLSAPLPPPVEARRSIRENVEATGSLYARRRLGAHALGAYARFLDERLRARILRGNVNIPTYLAARTRAEPEYCERLWHRAKEAQNGAPDRGDELQVIRQLAALYTAAISTD